MDRITGRDNIGVYYRHGAESGLHPYADRPRHEYKEAIDRLAAYEDTNLTPEEIIQMQAELQQLKGNEANKPKFCEDEQGGICTARDYGPNQYKDPCYRCCLGCGGAIEMSCTFVCRTVAEHYYPEEEPKAAEAALGGEA